MIPYGRQSISQDDIEAVIAVLKSDFLTQGPAVPRFEDAISQYSGAKYSVTFNSATSALHAACLALDVKERDIVWTTPISFVASANCALYCGARIDFVDIDPHSYNMSVESLEKKLVIAARNGALPKVVIPVHMCGQSCDMQTISALAKLYGFRVIEDASHAVGGKYQNQYIGGCQYSDITIFSFHPVKIVTSGEGGAALTNNEYLDYQLRLYRSHGINKDATLFSREQDGLWHYEQVALGYNYRLSDIHAALGWSQLKRADRFVQIRHEIASFYDDKLGQMNIAIPRQTPDAYSSMHLYVIRLNADVENNICKRVYQGLLERGIGVAKHYIPIPLQPYYSSLGFSMSDYPQAHNYYRESLSLPIYPGLNRESQLKVVESLAELLD